MTPLILAGSIVAIGAANPTFDAIFHNAEARLTDRFAEQVEVVPPDSIKIYLPFLDSDGLYLASLSSAYYHYDGGTLRLSFDGTRAADAQEVIIFSRAYPSYAFTGTNAFGARAKVQSYRSRRMRLAIMDGPPLVYRGSYDLSGPAARKLAASAAVELTISLSKTAIRDARCNSDFHAATLDNPIQLSSIECVVPGSIHTLRIVRRDTGEVLSDMMAGE